MSLFRVVTLDYACGPHVTEYGFGELLEALNGESFRISRIGSGAILLQFLDRRSLDTELSQILEGIQVFTSQFKSVVLLLTKKDADAVRNKLWLQDNSIEISGTTVGNHDACELFRVTGKPDIVNRFLSVCSSLGIEESNVVLECVPTKKSFGALKVNDVDTRVLEVAGEEWEFLKLTHFDEMLSPIYPEVCLKFVKPGFIELSGGDEDVRKVIKEAYRCLDNRKVHTYYKSESIVECLKCSWCTDLLRRKWDAAKVAATVTVTDRNTALIRSGGELAIALHILESTIEEATPIALPRDFWFPVEPSLWRAILAAANGKAVPVLDEKFRLINVAGKAEELTDVVEKIRELVAPGKHSNAFQTMPTASPSPVLNEKYQQIALVGNAEELINASGTSRTLVDRSKPRTASPKALTASPCFVEVVKRYYDKRISGVACAEAGCSSTSLFIRYTADKFILDGDPKAVDIAEQELVMLITSMQEIDRLSKSSSWDDRVFQIEQETCTLIQLHKSTDTVPRGHDDEKAINTEPSTDLRQRTGTDDKRLPNDSSQHSISCGVQLQVIQGSICDQEADVLVNSVTSSLDLKVGAVSLAFDRAAGRNLQLELYGYKYPGDFSILRTKGYNLRCKWVLHVICGPSSDQKADEKLRKLIYDCLKAAEDNKMTSIAFPPIGAGGLGYPVESVVKAFYNAMVDFNRERHRHLQTVTCVISDDKTYRVFTTELRNLRKRQASKPDPKKSVTGGSATEHEKKSASLPTTSGLPIFYWRVTGLESNIANAVQRLDSLENSRSISWQPGAESDNYDSASFKDRLDTGSTSQDALRAYEKTSEREPAFGMSAAAYQQNFNEGRSTATPQGERDVSGDAALVKRIASQLGSITNYASYWVSMDKETFKLLRIDQNRQEYRDVMFLLHDVSSHSFIEIIEIFRIQDKTQWLLYCEQQEKMKRELPVLKEHQRMLWFSCPQDDVLGLLRSGNLLNRSSAVRQDFGKGAYFYRDAVDAATVQMSTASAQGVKYIILASVLTGSYVIGNAKMVTLPHLPGDGKRYNSSVNNVKDPTIFVIYHDAQACPLYCVEFRTRQM